MEAPSFLQLNHPGENKTNSLLKMAHEFRGNFKTSPQPIRDTVCLVIIWIFCFGLVFWGFFVRCLFGYF